MRLTAAKRSPSARRRTSPGRRTDVSQPNRQAAAAHERRRPGGRHRRRGRRPRPRDPIPGTVGQYTGGTAAAGSYKVRVRTSDNAVEDDSNTAFTIVAAPQGTLALTAPNGGESWSQGAAKDHRLDEHRPCGDEPPGAPARGAPGSASSRTTSRPRRAALPGRPAAALLPAWPL